uniref:Uncharacterized protein n=1 Tax=Anopheles culicifacies TaxID=139723 RepID=A0A182MVU6_9DIPT
MSHRMSPKTRVVFKFIFGLGIWSFLVLGFFKLNGDTVLPHQIQQSPINGRLLLNKDNRWTGNEATSTTTDRYLSPAGQAGAMAGADEVLVDNRAARNSIVTDATATVISSTRVLSSCAFRLLIYREFCLYRRAPGMGDRNDLGTPA